MNFNQILDRLPFELASRLQSDPFFSNIPVVVAVKGNVAQEFQRQQAVITEKSGQRGVAVIVLQIVADDIYPGIPGAPMKLKPAFQVIENVEMNNDANGTGKSARMVARQIIKNIKISGLRGIVQGLKCAMPAIEPVDIKDLGDACVSEQVNFECQEFSNEQFLYCSPPTIAEAAGYTVALSCVTAGAQVWYTTDGSFPFPGPANKFTGSTAQLYTAPLAVGLNVPLTIRACAYLNAYTGGTTTDYIASSVEQFQVLLTS